MINRLQLKTLFYQIPLPISFSYHNYTNCFLFKINIGFTFQSCYSSYISLCLCYRRFLYWLPCRQSLICLSLCLSFFLSVLLSFSLSFFRSFILNFLILFFLLSIFLHVFPCYIELFLYWLPCRQSLIRCLFVSFSFFLYCNLSFFSFNLSFFLSFFLYCNLSFFSFNLSFFLSFVRSFLISFFLSIICLVVSYIDCREGNQYVI